jgi:hypothetical protein
MGKRGQRLVVQPGQMHVYVAVKDSDPASKPVPGNAKSQVRSVRNFAILRQPVCRVPQIEKPLSSRKVVFVRLSVI